MLFCIYTEKYREYSTSPPILRLSHALTRYPGLTASSSFEDFQLLLYTNGT